MGEMAERGDETSSDGLLTVEQLNGRIAQVVDSAADLHGVRCIGEVTNVSDSDVAIYFTLTDGEHELPCVVWESRYQNMDVDIEDGQEVILEGSVDYWTEGGKISLKPWQVSEVGEGEQAAALDRLEQELGERGWFDDERKQWPPEFPERVGVVTSLDGDARYDIQSAIHGQDPTIDLLIKDATVQGPDAPRSIANGIHHLDRPEDVDLIIAGRGGGSDTDLMAFNSEEVAEAIFTAGTPVVTAIGHTDDRFIADRVADMAAITPSRAGEYFAASREDFLDGTVEPLDRELEDAYDTYQRQQELSQESRRAAKYKAGMILLGLLLLIVLVLWLVV
ncbi:exodeoxyribonuclease VII large subunit [Halobacteriales archaeon QS_1_68_17]|nr:MAG: exodeoxyribonuclease VII large subunit [Halobacteriales archaeon QS_1_68_17]